MTKLNQSQKEINRQRLIDALENYKDEGAAHYGYDILRAARKGNLIVNEEAFTEE